jgi:hypothetical protein
VLAVLTSALHGLRLHRATGRSSRPAPADLIRRYRTYFLAGVLGFRGLAGVPPMVNLIAIYELRPILPLFVGWVLAVVLNFAFVPLVLRRWERSNSDVLPWLALDGLLAIALNVWGAAQVPGPVNDPYHDLFFFWCMGTAVLWAAWFGTRAGMLISLVSLPLQVAMTAVSGWVPLSESVPVIIARTAWLVVGTSSGWLILWIMRIAAEGVRAEGVRVGEKTARIRALRQLHDTALQTLEAIRRAGRVGRGARDRPGGAAGRGGADGGGRAGDRRHDGDAAGPYGRVDPAAGPPVRRAVRRGPRGPEQRPQARGRDLRGGGGVRTT